MTTPKSKKPRGRPFVKGQSGNPGGRPKENEEVKALARQYTTAAVERLVYWMASDNPTASVSASNAILDRAWGKPAQAVSHEVPPDGGDVTIIYKLRAENAGNRA